MENAMEHALDVGEQDSRDAKGYVEGAHPWRRFIARVIDTNLHSAVIFFVLAVVLGVVAPDVGMRLLQLFEGAGGRVLDVMLSVLVAMVVNALLIGFTGASLGKWLMGVRVTEADGRYLGYVRAFKREVLVWFRGFGMGVPIVNLFTLLNAYKQLDEQGRTSWDDTLGTRTVYRPNGPVQYLLGFLGVCTWIGFLYFAFVVL